MSAHLCHSICSGLCIRSLSPVVSHCLTKCLSFVSIVRHFKQKWDRVWYVRLHITILHEQGVLLMWINPVLPQLKDGNQTMNLTDVELGFISSGNNMKSWMSCEHEFSGHCIGSMIGAVMSGLVILLTKYLGHALMFAIMSALTSSAWFILYWVIMIISLQ